MKRLVYGPIVLARDSRVIAIAAFVLVAVAVALGATVDDAIAMGRLCRRCE